MKKCPVKKTIFGEEIQHTWAYISKTHRKCKVCKGEEILFGYVNYGEDWREKYK